MTSAPRSADAKLLAVSDLHVAFPENRKVIETIQPTTADDWLLVAGDVGEFIEDIRWGLAKLKERFTTVVWVPGNHELWTPPRDSIQLRGERRYRYLVEICRSLGVITPEDEYPVWHGPEGSVRVVPLFLLYDYTFFPPRAATKEAGLARAYEAGVVCTDEMLLHPDPYPSREAWCAARLRETERRLLAAGSELPMVFVNHFPLVRDPTEVLRYPEFAQWCGTVRTADWHIRFGAAAVVYGHLHIPRTTWYDGVRFEEVSVGYPREWRSRGPAPLAPRQILPYNEHKGHTAHRQKPTSAQVRRSLT
jgi:3',5'-cyclic AMP phosphodiesterase CpdA